jgi:hypothetical protein
VRQASEIEHALLVQYLYASFSVKARYQAVIGTGGGDSISLVGVAVQEMHHLARVNELLTDLHQWKIQAANLIAPVRSLVPCALAACPQTAGLEHR